MQFLHFPQDKDFLKKYSKTDSERMQSARRIKKRNIFNIHLDVIVNTKLKGQQLSLSISQKSIFLVNNHTINNLMRSFPLFKILRKLYYKSSSIQKP